MSWQWRSVQLLTLSKLGKLLLLLSKKSKPTLKNWRSLYLLILLRLSEREKFVELPLTL